MLSLLILNINIMQTSTTTDYGTRALLDLAMHADEGAVKLGEIAYRQRIPRPYLSQLMRPLVAGGLVRSVRGPDGGFSLACSPEEISMRQVYAALEGNSAAPGDRYGADDDLAMVEVVREFWRELSDSVEQVLGTTTLADLAQRCQRRSDGRAAMYHI